LQEGLTVDRNKAEAMLTEARAELTTAESAVTYLRQVVSGLEGLLKASPVAQPVFAPEHPQPATPAETPIMEDVPDRVYPRTPEAVLSVLRARPNFPFTFKQIWAEMVTNDLVDPNMKSGRNAYTNAARRLSDDPKSNVVRDEHERYVYRTNSADSADESGGYKVQTLQAVNS